MSARSPVIADAARAGGIQALAVVHGQRPEGVTCALGGDPGGTSGLFLGAWRAGERKPYLTRAWQCDMGAAPELLRWVLTEYGGLIQAAQFEAFDARERSRKMRGFSASAQHALIAGLVAITAGFLIPVTTRPPSPVKTWATDKRMTAAGLDKAVGKMTDDALDAARHCAYCACKDLGMRDPLSRAVSR